MKARLLALLLGPAPWGAIDVWPSRYGYAHFRLTVYPPGIDPGGRFRLRLWRTWPTTVGLAGLALALAAAAVGIPPFGDAVVGLAGATAALVALASMSRRVRPLVRSRSGATETAGNSLRLIGDMALIDRCWERLTDADAQLRAGVVTPAQHELTWSLVWADLAEPSRGVRSRHPGAPALGARELKAPRPARPVGSREGRSRQA